MITQIAERNMEEVQVKKQKVQETIEITEYSEYHFIKIRQW